MPGMVGQPEFGRLDEFGLLAGGNAHGGVAVAARQAVAHFNEDDRVPIQHHQIEFAVTGGVVAVQQLEACALQFRAGSLLEDGLKSYVENGKEAWDAA